MDDMDNLSSSMYDDDDDDDQDMHYPLCISYALCIMKDSQLASSNVDFIRLSVYLSNSPFVYLQVLQVLQVLLLE